MIRGAEIILFLGVIQTFTLIIVSWLHDLPPVIVFGPVLFGIVCYLVVATFVLFGAAMSDH